MTYTGIRVPKKYQLKNVKDRTAPELKLDGNYFVCFGNNLVIPCKLLEIRENNRVYIQKFIPTQFKIRKGYSLLVPFNELNSDEIGDTPIQAVYNTVTN